MKKKFGKTLNGGIFILLLWHKYLCNLKTTVFYLAVFSKKLFDLRLFFKCYEGSGLANLANSAYLMRIIIRANNV